MYLKLSDDENGISFLCKDKDFGADNFRNTVLI